MPATKPKLAFHIICDDVREEVGNKLSFIGVYSKDIFVPNIPITLPKLCFFLSINHAKGGNSIIATLHDPTGKKIGKAIRTDLPNEIKKPITVGMVAAFSPLRIENDGNYTLNVTFNNSDKSNDIVFSIKCPSVKDGK